ncbi:ragulator complex protein LAMTOR4 homolog [Condylostylus longicornis]|uniref:ragulator complex protein LAMTOR4 homolog n=1 Tax=Condylostylus longicornis TaxID=2530218 RepID=UPI00244DF280|nr:ragulator complex protein LAMTOR4 homolog [Condylostylus longicornis]
MLPPLERIAYQIGYLVLNSDGAVLESGGELENDERSANIIMGMIQIAESVDEEFMPENGCERISIVYDDHSYTICMSNRKIIVVKRKHTNYIPSADNEVNNLLV